MIDRSARDKTAEIIRAFAERKLSNFAMERLWPDSEDRAILAAVDFMWRLHDDFKEHYMLEELLTHDATMLRIELIMKFMKSDHEYVYPYFCHSGAVTYSRWAVFASGGLLAIANLVAERRERRYIERMSAVGDLDVWPYRSARDLPTDEKS